PRRVQVAARQGHLRAARLEPGDHVTLNGHARSVELREGLIEHRLRTIEVAARLTRPACGVGRLCQRTRATYFSRQSKRLFPRRERPRIVVRQQANRLGMSCPPAI